MRALAGPPVVSVRSPVAFLAAADFQDMDVRERRGNAAFTTMLTETLPFRYAEQHRVLTNAELWQVYKVVPDVRACVEGITRKISTWDWGVFPTIDPSDERYERALEIAEQVRAFLAGPNNDKETWQELLSKILRDLLVFDALAIEHVADSKGKLTELVALRGCDVSPVYDSKQRLQGYKQENATGAIVGFEPDQLTYMNLHPNTTAPGGAPLIEALVMEVITLMRQSQHLMKAFDADEVPPGILLLSGLAGKAAERAVASLRQMKGADHKLRVLTTNNPGGIGANWVELRHTPKELELKDLVREIRRLVWRVFGVKPASMGDTEATPRATAQVQVDAEESDLILPFLELFEQKLNMQIVPLIVGEEALAGLVAFEFDLAVKLSPQQEKDQGLRDNADMDRGAMTVNERRAARGLPPVEFGDTPLVKTGAGYSTLQDVVEGNVPAPAAPGFGPPTDEEPTDEDEETGDGEGGGVTDPDAADPAEGKDDEEEDEDAKDEKGKKKDAKKKKSRTPLPGRGRTPGARAPASGRPLPTQSVRTRSGKVLPFLPRAARHFPPPSTATTARFASLPLQHGAVSEPEVSFRGVRSSDLPSDWQPEGKFKGYRTLDLGALGDAIVAYQREVSPLYRRARMDCVAAVRSALGDGKISNEELPRVLSKVRDELDTLKAKWSMSTEPLYRRAARIGRDAAVDFTASSEVAKDWETRGSAYHTQAMAYLTADRGLLSDLRGQITEAVVAVVRSRGRVLNIREDDPTAVVDGVDVPLLLGAVRQIFDSNEHRVSNWSGRLVDLANDVLGRGMQEGNGQTTGGKTADWYYEWVSVGDEAMCPTCRREGAKDFRPISAMQIQPGGNTECRAKCRCVLVFWLKSEIDAGKATRLSNYDAAAA
jgi:hypothetical protein